jgi:hypothetical protein
VDTLDNSGQLSVRGPKPLAVLRGLKAQTRRRSPLRFLSARTAGNTPAKHRHEVHDTVTRGILSAAGVIDGTAVRWRNNGAIGAARRRLAIWAFCL